jgi:hypothetical protein
MLDQHSTTKSKSTKTWRDILPVHPAAELFPLMSETELRELGEDIKKNGLKLPIILWSPHPLGERKLDDVGGLGAVKDLQLLDGRNRLDALALNGVRFVTDDGEFDWLALRADTVKGLIYVIPTESDAVDPYSYAISLNIQRRHLTAEQKRELIAKVLKAKPDQSNRQIAKQVKADHKTVGKKREQLESTGEIPQLKKTTGADGKERKTKPKTKPKAVALTTHSINEDGRLSIPDRLPVPAKVNIDPFAPLPKPKAEQKVFDSPQEAHAPKKSLIAATADLTDAMTNLCAAFGEVQREFNAEFGAQEEDASTLMGLPDALEYLILQARGAIEAWEALP